jgi:hypothetical protein
VFPPPSFSLSRNACFKTGSWISSGDPPASRRAFPCHSGVCEDIYGFLELRFEAPSDLGGAEIGKESIAGHSVSVAVGKEAAVLSHLNLRLRFSA